MSLICNPVMKSSFGGEKQILHVESITQREGIVTPFPDSSSWVPGGGFAGDTHFRGMTLQPMRRGAIRPCRISTKAHEASYGTCHQYAVCCGANCRHLCLLCFLSVFVANQTMMRGQVKALRRGEWSWSESNEDQDCLRCKHKVERGRPQTRQVG